MRALFDTNIYVSAFAIPGGRAQAALLKAVKGEVRLVISKPIIHELLDVLARKFGRDAEELSRVAVFLAELAEVVQPRRKIEMLSDDTDNRILECAIAGRADVIVTGDRAMLELGEYQGVRIMTLREFLGARRT
ncbi:MAG: putative toxin-antitoxin system toxin component, PIN family [Candidatus Methylomirabilaceae bacterium]